MQIQGRSFVLALSLTLSAAACSRSNQTPADTLVTAVPSPVNNLDPLLATDANTQRINHLIHATLTRTSQDLRPEPYLAESYQVKPTGVEFLLRSGCRFHDGRPVTREDVIASIQAFQNPENHSPMQKNFAVIQEFKLVGDRGLLLRVAPERVAGLLYDLSLVPIRSLSGPTPNPQNGAGPYHVVQKDPSNILLAANDPGCIPAGKMPKIQVKVVRDDISRFLKLQRGELDLIINDLDYRKVRLIIDGKVPGLKAVVNDGTTVSYLGMNLANPHLKKLAVRRAIAKSLDLPSIITYKLSSLATPAASLLSPQSWFHNPYLKPIAQDLPEARRLLDEAGYFNGANNKPPLRLTLKTTTFRPIIENARAMAEQMRQVGIDVTHKAFEWGTFYADVKARNTELFLLRWVGVASPDLLRDVYHSANLGENNRTNYSNPAMDEKLDAALKTTNLEAKRQALWDAQALAAEDLPSILLWYNQNTASFRDSLSGLELSPNGDWYCLIGATKAAK